MTYKTDYGVIIQLQLIRKNGEPYPLTGLTGLKIYLSLKGETIERDLTVEDEDEGRVSYVIQEGEMSHRGTLFIQPKIVGNGLSLHGSIKQEKVKKILEIT